MRGLKRFLLCAAVILGIWNGSTVYAGTCALPDGNKGEKVVLTGFEVVEMPKTEYYTYEKLRGYMDKSDANEKIELDGAKLKLQYTVDRTAYETVITLDDSAPSIGDNSELFVEFSDLKGLSGYYKGVKIYFWWKYIKEYEMDGETYYAVNKKQNAICVKCGDTLVEVPVTFNKEVPVKKITVTNNLQKTGVYQYNASEVKLKGFEITIYYNDGRESKKVVWPYDDDNYSVSLDGCQLTADVEESDNFSHMIVSFHYMGFETTAKVPVLKNPVKEIQVLKQPKKLKYSVLNKDADLYGAELKIKYWDGTNKKLNIKTHKNKIQVSGKYKEIMEAYRDVQNEQIHIFYMGYHFSISTNTKLPEFESDEKKVNENKSFTGTMTESNPTKLYVFTPKKSGRYVFDSILYRVNNSTGKKKKVSNEFYQMYVLDSKGKYCGITESMEDDMKYGYDLEKGKTYYFYLTSDDDIYSKNDIGVGYKCEISAKIVYKQPLKGKVNAINYTKTYGDEDFRINSSYEVNGISFSTQNTYKSSNKKVATIDSDGYVTIKSAGVTKITITSKKNSSLRKDSKTITLTVKKAKGRLSVKKESYTKYCGNKAFSLGAKGTGVISYSSDNRKVVEVSPKGKVTIKGKGTAIVTVKARSNNYTTVTKKVKIVVKAKKNE